VIFIYNIIRNNNEKIKYGIYLFCRILYAFNENKKNGDNAPDSKLSEAVANFKINATTQTNMLVIKRASVCKNACLKPH